MYHFNWSQLPTRLLGNEILQRWKGESDWASWCPLLSQNYSSQGITLKSIYICEWACTVIQKKCIQAFKSSKHGQTFMSNLALCLAHTHAQPTHPTPPCWWGRSEAKLKPCSYEHNQMHYTISRYGQSGILAVQSTVTIFSQFQFRSFLSL